MIASPWTDAIGRMLTRIRDTAARVKNGFPHWAEPEPGLLTTTPGAVPLLGGRRDERRHAPRDRDQSCADVGARPMSGNIATSALLVFLVGCGNIQVSPHDPVGTASLKPVHEDKEAGLVGIADGFNVKGYRIVAVDRFVVAAPGINDDDDRELARTIPPFLQSELVRRLRESGLFERVINLGEASVPDDVSGVLNLEGTITALAGGSRGLRFWIGFGVGRSKFQVETRFTNRQTAQVVLVTSDRRVAAMSEAASLDYGGSSEQLIRESASDMARDLVKFLLRLSQSPAPSAK